MTSVVATMQCVCLCFYLNVSVSLHMKRIHYQVCHSLSSQVDGGHSCMVVLICVRIQETPYLMLRGSLLSLVHSDGFSIFQSWLHDVLYEV